MVSTSSAIYVVGLAKSFASYTLHIVSISTQTGEELASANVPSSISGGPSTLLTFARREHQARVAWLQDGNIHTVILAPELAHTKPVVFKDVSYAEIINVGLGSHNQFVATKSDGSASVLSLQDQKPGVKVLWEFKDSVCDSVFLSNGQLANSTRRQGQRSTRTRFTWVPSIRTDFHT